MAQFGDTRVLGEVVTTGKVVSGDRLEIERGSDLMLKGQVTSPQEAGDIVFADPNGGELARLWQTSGQLTYRVASGTMNKVFYAGNHGSGSGLDADLLDGNHSSAFATSGHGHSTLNHATTNTSQTDSGYIQFGPMNASTAHIYTDRPNFYFNKELYANNGNKAWHAGSDGSGSGLDADLLDGYHMDYYGNGNTIVGRHGAGYIFNIYHNQSSGQEAYGANSYFYETGDGYLRKKPLANVKSEIVVNSSVENAIAGTIYSIIASGGDYRNGYEKYSNGYGKQWKTFTTTIASAEMAFVGGTGYKSGWKAPGNWPTAFSGVPSVQYTLSVSNGAWVWLGSVKTPTATVAGEFFIFKWGSTDSAIEVYIEAYGLMP